ncbi:MAG: hypothetical protein NTAFB05_31230 [Nitrobacter sp.]
MSALPEAKLDLMLARHAALESELLSQVSADRYVQMTRELAELNPVVEAVKNWRVVKAEIAGIDAMIADPATDAEMRAMAEAERPALEAQGDELAQKIRIALLPKDAMDERNVMLEIRAGTGGDEASLFAGDLFACTSVSQACRAGRWRWCRRAKAPWAATRKSSPRCGAAGPTPS